MQLSAANLLIAAQQLSRAQAPAQGGAQFASALEKDGGVEGAGFEPMAFKQAAPAKSAAPIAASPAPASYGGTGPLGGNIDIRV